MNRRLDIGVASYGNPEKLRTTLESIRQHTVSDWRCFIIDNPHPLYPPYTPEYCQPLIDSDPRFVLVDLPKNIGYAGAVNKLFELAQTEYIAYFDNDIEIQTPAWDNAFAELLDGNPECGWVFPGRGHYGFHNGKYDECLWSAGYAWMLRRKALIDITQMDKWHLTLYDQIQCTELCRHVGEPPWRHNPGWFDMHLGHHEEVDFMIRMRLAGYTVGCCPAVSILHHETHTRSKESEQRIHDGVVRWMNKWNRYFCGDALKYSMTEYDPRALRYTDWPPCALYLERMTLNYFPNWNTQWQDDGPAGTSGQYFAMGVEEVSVPGVGEMDAVRVLKPKGPYRGRAI